MYVETGAARMTDSR